MAGEMNREQEQALWDLEPHKVEAWDPYKFSMFWRAGNTPPKHIRYIEAEGSRGELWTTRR